MALLNVMLHEWKLGEKGQRKNTRAYLDLAFTHYMIKDHLEDIDVREDGLSIFKITVTK